MLIWFYCYLAFLAVTTFPYAPDLYLLKSKYLMLSGVQKAQEMTLSQCEMHTWLLMGEL